MQYEQALHPCIYLTWDAVDDADGRLIKAKRENNASCVIFMTLYTKICLLGDDLPLLATGGEEVTYVFLDVLLFSVYATSSWFSPMGGVCVTFARLGSFTIQITSCCD